MRVRGVAGVWIATDDARIADAARGFGAEVLMTTSEARNGTERCAEALAALPDDIEAVANLQGDAPLTPPWFVEEIVAALAADKASAMATPVLRCDGPTLAALLADRRAGRVGGTTAALAETGRALYFSKEVLPHGAEGAGAPVWLHVGAYVYRRDALAAYAAWPESPLERAEGLEQLRFLEHAARVACVEVDARGRRFWEVNNPEDVARVETVLREDAA